MLYIVIVFCIKMQQMCGLTAYSLHISDAVPKLCCTFAPEI